MIRIDGDTLIQTYENENKHICLAFPLPAGYSAERAEEMLASYQDGVQAAMWSLVYLLTFLGGRVSVTSNGTQIEFDLGKMARVSEDPQTTATLSEG